MGLTYAFNEILSCVLTGLSTAIFLGVAARCGLLPLVFITTKNPDEKEKEE
ncbi:hypothetical protein D3C72_2579840 [compost metagenome]